jgi:threonine/homoserine efflux transporter RhtA
MAVVFGFLPASDTAQASRGLLASMGIVLATAGIQIAQWVGASGRLYDAVGAALVTAFGAMFGWIALYGDDRGFRTTASGGGLSVSSHGSATGARIAFGIGAALTGIFALWAWKRVLRRRD